MHIIETYWYAWIAAAMVCIAFAFVRYARTIRNIDKAGTIDGFTVTMIFAAGGWIFTFVTMISIILNIISYYVK